MFPFRISAPIVNKLVMVLTCRLFASSLRFATRIDRLKTCSSWPPSFLVRLKLWDFWAALRNFAYPCVLLAECLMFPSFEASNTFYPYSSPSCNPPFSCSTSWTVPDLCSKWIIFCRFRNDCRITTDEMGLRCADSGVMLLIWEFVYLMTAGSPV